MNSIKTRALPVTLGFEVLAIIGIVIAGLALPGGGMLVAVGLLFTRARRDLGLMIWSFALGACLLALSALVALGGVLLRPT